MIINKGVNTYSLYVYLKLCLLMQFENLFSSKINLSYFI